MKAQAKIVCLILAFSLISFIAGVSVVPLAIGGYLGLFVTNRPSQEQEAKAFFYRTMNSLFEDTYNIEEGSVSTEFMNEFKKYEPQLGKKCRLYIIDSESGYYECFAFFPSGDVFGLQIVLMNDKWILYGFNRRDWDSFWKGVVNDVKGG